MYVDHYYTKIYKYIGSNYFYFFLRLTDVDLKLDKIYLKLMRIIDLPKRLYVSQNHYIKLNIHNIIFLNINKSLMVYIYITYCFKRK